jgi:hypothetical protein
MGTQGNESWCGSSADGERIQTEIDDTPKGGEVGGFPPRGFPPDLACSDEASSEDIVND